MPNEMKPNQSFSPINQGPEAKPLHKRPDNSFVTVTLWTISGVVLAACSGGSNVIRDIGGDPADVPSTDVTVPHIQGAVIIYDGVRYTTDALGQAQIPTEALTEGITVELEGAKHQLTGLEVGGQVESFAGGSFASPLTTLIVEVMREEGLTAEEALVHIQDQAGVTPEDIVTIDDVLTYSKYLVTDESDSFPLVSIALYAYRTNPAPEGVTTEFQLELIRELVDGYQTASDYVTPENYVPVDEEAPADAPSPAPTQADLNAIQTVLDAVRAALDAALANAAAGTPFTFDPAPLSLTEGEALTLGDVTALQDNNGQITTQSLSAYFSFVDPYGNTGDVVSALHGIVIAKPEASLLSLGNAADIPTGSEVETLLTNAGLNPADYVFVAAGDIASLTLTVTSDDPDTDFDEDNPPELKYYLFDGEVLSNQASWALSITAVNNAPTLAEGNFIINEGEVGDDGAYYLGELDITDPDSPLEDLQVDISDSAYEARYDAAAQSWGLYYTGDIAAYDYGQGTTISVTVTDNFDPAPASSDATDIAVIRGGIFLASTATPEDTDRAFSGEGVVPEGQDGSTADGAVLLGFIGDAAGGTITGLVSVNGVSVATNADGNNSGGSFLFRTDNFDLFYTGPALDHDTQGDQSWTLTFSLDNGSTQSYVINLQDINDVTPVFSTGASVTGDAFVEGAEIASGQLIYTANVEVDDAATSITFALTGTEDDDLFDIDAEGNVTFKTATIPDYETSPSYSFTVEATSSDAEGNEETATQIVTIPIININDVAPVFTSATSVTDAFVENTEILATQAVYTATVDADAAITSTSFALTGTADDNLFDIDEDGNVTFKTATTPDFEAKSSYNVTVTATSSDADGNEETATQDVTLLVTNILDIAPIFSSGTTAAPFNDNSFVLFTATVYTASASTADAASTGITYSLTGNDDDSLFNINDRSGRVFFKNREDVDFETKSSYTFTVTATSTDGTNEVSASQVVTIPVTDINDTTPTFTSGDEATAIVENTEVPTTQTLYTAVAEPVDASVTSTSYALTSGQDGDLFDIDSNGNVTFKANTTPDYETSPSYSFTVEATTRDAEGNAQTATQEVTLPVTNIYDAPVTITSVDFGMSVREDESYGTDPTNVDNVFYYAEARFDETTTQGTPNAITWSIDDRDDGDLFAIDASSGHVTFKANTTPDHEAKGQYIIHVVATDAEGNSDDKRVRISVTDANDAPAFDDPAFTRSNEAFDYNSDGSTTAIKLGTVAVTDVDDGDELSYEFVSTPTFDGVAVGVTDFQIDSATGEITYHGTGIARTDTGFVIPGDYEIEFEVKVTDDFDNNPNTDGESDTETFTVAVTVPDLPPRWILQDLDPDNLPQGFPLDGGQVTALKVADLVTGLPISEGTGTEGTIFETLQDDITLFDLLKAFVVDPQGEDITAFGFTLSSNDLAANQASNVDVFLVNAETGDRLADDFILNDANKDTKIRIAHNGDSEGPDGLISIIAYDATQAPNGVPIANADRSVTLDFLLDVTQVDDPLTFNITTNTASINEGDYTGAPQDLAIAFTLVDEEDDWSDLRSQDFTVFYANSSGVAGDATDDFTVISDGADGFILQATGNLNYEGEAGSTLTLVVEATGAAHQVQSPPVTVTLIDVNEPPTGITLNKISFLPGVNEVGTITVIDEDTNDVFRDYSYELTGDDAAQFALDQSTGEITFIGASAGPEGTSYDIILTATDNNDGLTATDNTNPAFTVTDDFTIYVGGLYLVPETGGSAPSTNDDSSIPMGEFSGSDLIPENTDGDEDTPIAHVRVSEGRYPTELGNNDDGDPNTDVPFRYDPGTAELFYTGGPIDVDDPNQTTEWVLRFLRPNLAGDGTEEVVFIIGVQDLLDKPADITFTADTLTFNEGVAYADQTLIGEFLATPDVAENALSYNIAVSGSARKADGSELTGDDFEINDHNNLVIKGGVTFAPTSDGTEDLILTITVVEEGADPDVITPASEVITLTINEVNDPPVVTKGQDLATLEEVNLTTAAIATGITFTIAHPGEAYDSNNNDNGGAADASRWSITGTGAEKFELARTTDNIWELYVKEGVSLNYEDSDSHEQGDTAFDLAVTYTDAGDATSDPVTVGVALTNLFDEAPRFDTNVTATALDENVAVPASQVIYDAAATQDAAATGDITYSLTGSDDDALFDIDSEGRVTFKTATTPDFETQDTYVFTVTASSSDGTTTLTTDHSVTVPVTNENEAPTGITIDAASFMAVAGTAVDVGTFTVVDPDANDSFTFALTGTDAASFTIDDATGVLTFKADATPKGTGQTYDITVTATDAGGLSTPPVDFTISEVSVYALPIGVTDDPANRLFSGSSLVEENVDGSAGTAGIAIATLVDSQGRAITGLSLDTDNFSVQTDASNVTTLYYHGAAFDHEATPNQTWTIGLHFDDEVALGERYIVRLKDIADNAVSLAFGDPELSFDEGTLYAAGTVIGTLQVTTDVVAADWDYEIAITDGFVKSSETTLSPDDFVIDKDTGEVSFARDITFASLSDPTGVAQAVVKITVTEANAEAGVVAAEQFLPLTLNEVNTPPRLTVPTSSATIDEVNLTTAVIATGITFDVAHPSDAYDSDFNDNGENADASRFSITGTGAEKFELVRTTDNVWELFVKEGVNLDFDAGNERFDLAVTYTDAGGATSAAQNVTVTVNNINEAPVFDASTLDELTLSYDADGTVTAVVLGTISATDDEGDPILYTADRDPLFNDQVLSGNAVIVVGNEVRYVRGPIAATDDGYLAPGTYDLVVTFNASDGVTTSVTHTIEITVPNLPPRWILQDLDPANLPEGFPEDVTTTTLVGLQAADLSATGLAINEGTGSARTIFENLQDDDTTLFDLLQNFVVDDQGQEVTAFSFEIVGDDLSLVNAETGVALADDFILNATTQNTKIRIAHNGNEDSPGGSISIIAYDETHAPGGVLNADAIGSAPIDFNISVTPVDDPLSFVFNTTSATIAEGAYDTDNPADLGITFTITDVDNDRSDLTADDFGVVLSAFNGSFSDLFAVRAVGNGVFALDVVGDLDFEAGESFGIQVIVSGITGTPSSEELTINLTNINDEAPVFTSPATAEALVENVTVSGTPFGVPVEDAGPALYIAEVTTDAAIPQTNDNAPLFRLVGSDDDDLFVIGTPSGVVRFSNSETPDWEVKAEYVFTIEATYEGLSSTHTVTVPVTNVIDVLPEITPTTDIMVNENQAYGNDAAIQANVVYTATATHDAATSVAWSLGTGDDNDFFAIDSDGRVTFKAATTPDFETKSSYAIQVVATDTAGNEATQAVTVTVEDGNDAPAFDDPAFTRSTEPFDYDADGTTTPISLGSVAATDQDDDDTITYEFVGTPTFNGQAVASDAFQIDSATGDITYHGNEIAKTETGFVPAGDHPITFVIEATDTNQATTTVSTSITVTVPNFAPEWRVDNPDRGIIETVLTAPPELGITPDVIAIDIPAIKEGGNSDDSLGGLQAIVTSLFDLLQAFVRDPQGEAITGFTFAIAHEDFTLVDATTGIALADDFVLTDANKDTILRIDHNGDSNGGDGILVITAHDANGSSSQEFALPVKQVDDPLSFDFGGTITGTVAEGAYSATNTSDVGISFTLPDEDNDWSSLGSDDFIIYNANSNGTIGAESAAFSVRSDGAGGYILQASGALDFETQDIHYLVIEASGATGEVRSERLTVTLTDVNEAPTGLTLDDNVFAIGATTVGTLTVVDEDADTLITDYEYEITGADGARFNIDATTGELSHVFGMQTKGSGSTYEITITATDNTHTVTQDFTITEGGLYFIRDGEANIPENRLYSGAAILRESDDGRGTDITLGTFYDTEGRTITSLQSSSSIFSVPVNSSDLVFDGGPQDYDVDPVPSWTVQLQLDDSSVHPFTINLIDEVDEPVTTAFTEASPGSATFDEDSTVAADTVIGTVTGTPDVEGSVVTYGLVSVSGSATKANGEALTLDDFTIDDASGVLRIANEVVFDLDSAGTVTVTVSAEEGALASVTTATHEVTITVANVNQAPSEVKLDNLFFTVNSSTAGGQIATATAEDPDEGDSHSFTLGGTDASYFSIDSATGRLSTKSGIGDGKGSGSTYEIAITATDAAGLTVTSTFTLTQGGVYIVRTGEADIPANQLMSGADVLPENQAGSTSNPIGYIKDSSGAEIRNILATGMPFNVSENATGDAWNVFYTGNALDHETATTTSWRLSIVYESNNVTVFDIALQDVADEPVGLFFEEGTLSFDSEEEIAADTLIGDLSVTTDLDDAGWTAEIAVDTDLTKSDGTEITAGDFAINDAGLVTFASAITFAKGSSVKEEVTLTITVTEEGYTGTTPATQEIVLTVNTPAFTDPSTLNAVTGTSAPETLAGTSGDDFINGHHGHDTITAAGGDDVIAGGHGDDTITLSSGAETILYRFDQDADGAWRAKDGGDVIHNFKVGEDKLIFFDDTTGSTQIKNLADFVDGWLNGAEMSFEAKFNSTFTMVDGVKIGFAAQGVENPTVAVPFIAGLQLTVNFHADDHRPFTDFTGLNGTFLATAENLSAFFGDGGLDVLTYDDVPIDSNDIL